MQSQLPKIAFFTLGGTIASVPNADGRDAIPRLSGSDLFASVPQVAELAELVPTSFRRYPSGDLTITDILELGELIEKKAVDGFDGVVVTQGTDTLEETSFLLDLVLHTDIPVVLTGAMRNAGLPGADGPANVLAAVRTAASPLAHGLGPLVVFNDEIHLARYVRKTHTSSTAAFRSPNAGPIGWVNEDRVHIPLVPRHKTEAVNLGADQAPLPRVALLKLGLDADADLLESAVDLGYSGIIVEVFGGGHVPAKIVEALKRTAVNVPVIFASRTGAGELYRTTYAFPGSERDLLASGLMSAGVFDGCKARLLLTLLIAAGASRELIQQRFYSN
ncbi:asparaginase [Paenarthrobacter sp. NPDC089675]|uniref:asparaginase n=1 Tax=Paenarthrobacter sp. NPDC089675 TaxID=3364376 RepID=UPI0038146A11